MIDSSSVEDYQGLAKQVVKGSYTPELLTLGYIAKRKEQRLIFVMPVTMMYEGETYSVKSKDISINGLKLIMPRTLIIPGKEVLISFDYFIEEQKSFIDDSKKIYFEDITYKIVDVAHTVEKSYLSLIQQDLSDTAKSHFQQFINTHKLQYKLDAQDILMVSKSKYMEHLYLHNMYGIPFFLSRKKVEGKTRYYIEHLIETVKNKELLRFFTMRNTDSFNYDFSPFMLPHRLKHFANAAIRGSVMLMFCYWENNKLHSLCDFELNTPQALSVIGSKVMSRNGKIFALHYKPVRTPGKARMNAITEMIMQDIGKREAIQLLQKTQRYLIQFMLTDITSIFFSEHSCFTPFFRKEDKAQKVKVWCENILKYMYSDEQLGHVELEEQVRPEKIRFHVHKVRYDIRYIHKMDVELKVRNTFIPAETVDFSKNGIGVTFQYRSDYQLVKNDHIYVSFPEFGLKITDINFYNVDFKIAAIKYDGDRVELGLVRLLGEQNRQVGAFFSRLINKNKNKLDICDRNHLDHSLSQLIEAYVDANINSIPVTIVKDKENEHYIRNIGLPSISTNLTDCFMHKRGGYNFKLLTSQQRLKELYSRTMNRHDNREELSLTLFLYTEMNANGLEEMYSYTSLEIKYLGDMWELLEKVFSRNGACIKLNFVNQMEVDPDLINRIIELINPINRSIAASFKLSLSDVVGFVDMMDVTAAYRILYEMHHT